MGKQTDDLFELIGSFSTNDGKYGFLKDIQTNLRINIILIIWKVILPETEVTQYSIKYFVIR